MGMCSLCKLLVQNERLGDDALQAALRHCSIGRVKAGSNAKITPARILIKSSFTGSAVKALDGYLHMNAVALALLHT